MLNQYFQPEKQQFFIVSPKIAALIFTNSLLSLH